MQDLNRLLKQSLVHSDPDRLQEVQRQGLSSSDMEFLENALKPDGLTLSELFSSLRTSYENGDASDTLNYCLDLLQDTVCQQENANDLIRIEALPFIFSTLLQDSRDSIVESSLILLTTCASNNFVFQQHCQSNHNALSVCIHFFKHSNDLIKLRAASFASALMQHNSPNIQAFGQQGISSLLTIMDTSPRLFFRVLTILNSLAFAKAEYPELQDLFEIRYNSVIDLISIYLLQFSEDPEGLYLQNIVEAGLSYFSLINHQLFSDQHALIHSIITKFDSPKYQDIVDALQKHL
ncbi:hypothetical protein GEMRC1_004371 [Eukaryota sp. GEM-RC1]